MKRLDKILLFFMNYFDKYGFLLFFVVGVIAIMHGLFTVVKKELYLRWHLVCIGNTAVLFGIIEIIFGSIVVLVFLFDIIKSVDKRKNKYYK